MSAFRVLLFGIVVLLLASCGQIVTENLPVSQPPPDAGPGANQTVVLLPFADYSNGDNVEITYKRNMMVMEAFTDQLTARGFQLPVQEDVFKHLVDKSIIQLLPQQGALFSSNSHGSLQAELKADWSPAMKSEISNLLQSEQQREAAQKAAERNPLSSAGLHGLDQQSLGEIGAKFGADYIVRGRIIEYDLTHETTWEPQRTGLIPLIYGGANQLLFGIAKSEKYDSINNFMTGAIIGAAVGNELTTPIDPKDADNYRFVNSLIWGTTSGIVAYVGNKGNGEPPQAVVQLRVWVQDAETGKVVWTNRARVKVAPESVFADSQTANLFNTAVNKVVTSLVDDFVTTMVN